MRIAWIALIVAARASATSGAVAEPSVVDLSSWRFAPSFNVSATGATISTDAFDASTSTWLPVTVPCTVLACLQQNGVYVDAFYGSNITSIPAGQFNSSWWFRTTFRVDGQSQRFASLRFLGINYRANLWLNGHLLATNTTLVGTFRYFELDITPAAVWEGENVVALEVFRPYDRALPSSNHDLDLADSFIDWAPSPPDASMGLWRSVHLLQHGPVVLRSPAVFTALPSPTGAAPTHSAALTFPYANASVLVCVQNFGSSSLNVTLRARMLFAAVAGSVAVPPVEVTLSFVVLGNATQRVELLPSAFPQLSVASPTLWWPRQMGVPALHTLELELLLDDGTVSDKLTTPFGLRTASSSLDAAGNRVILINTMPILIRGAGWAPDLFLRDSDASLRAQLSYAADMGLNAIRLEGKLGDDAFFAYAGELGLLVLPGWECCDAWQHWPWWGPEQQLVSVESLRSQLQRLRIYPAVATFFISSDELPPATVEQAYLTVAANESWTSWASIISAASAGNSSLSGPTGVKMSGPYSWEPPNYWLLDSGQEQLGGAWGFLTEGGPGENPLTLQSLQSVVPADQLWPPSPNDCWGHCGNPMGLFGTLSRFNGPLAARYGGAASSLPQYLAQAALAAYEGHRAYAEGYSRNKYAPATGFIHWMMDSAWPSGVWHLWEPSLIQPASFFAFRTALSPLLHVLYSYDDASVAIINSAYAEVLLPNLIVVAEVFLPNGTTWAAITAPVPASAVAPDSSTRVPAIVLPTQEDMLGSLGPNATYFVRLRLSSGDTPCTGWNTYWLSTSPDVLDWRASNFYMTPCASFADYSQLQQLGHVQLVVTEPQHVERLGREAFPHSLPLLHGMSLPAREALASFAVGAAAAISTLTFSVQNTSPVASATALLVRLRIVDPSTGRDVVPAFFSDNYFTLRPGESTAVTVTFAELPSGMPEVVASADWNAAMASSWQV